MSDPRIPSAEQEANVRKLADYPLPPSPPFDEESVEIFALIQKYLVAAIAWADAERDRANTAERELKQWREWDDADDEWSAATAEAFPARSGSHEAYATAMAMVSHRQSKGNLVELVNWLLVRITAAEARVVELTSWHDDEKTWRVGAERELASAGDILGAVIMAAMPLGPGETRSPGPHDEHAAMHAVLTRIGQLTTDRERVVNLRQDCERRLGECEQALRASTAREREAVARAERAEEELERSHEYHLSDLADAKTKARAAAFSEVVAYLRSFTVTGGFISAEMEVVKWCANRIEELGKKGAGV